MSCNVMSLTCSSYVQGDAQHTMSDQTSFVETICLACELYKGLWPDFWAYNTVANALEISLQLLAKHDAQGDAQQP